MNTEQINKAVETFSNTLATLRKGIDHLAGELEVFNQLAAHYPVVLQQRDRLTLEVSNIVQTAEDSGWDSKVEKLEDFIKRQSEDLHQCLISK